MRQKSQLLTIAAACAMLTLAVHAASAQVTVGNSTLIGDLDYSDTYTIGAASPIAARQSYAVQGFPLPAGVDVVENNYGNTSRSWGTTNWSIATDASNNPGGFGYPGGSGAGTVDGFTQRGGGGDWSIQYGLRDQFVVQLDAVQQPDRVDITIGDTPNNIFGAGNLSVFFRESNHPSYPEVGIFNGSLETDTGLSSGIAGNNEWHNYALLVDVPNDTIEPFVDETSLGVIDLSTIGGGAYAGILSNAFVGTGGSGADRLWSDNFQVGSVAAAVPEPSSLVAWALVGIAGLAFFARRRRR